MGKTGDGSKMFIIYNGGTRLKTKHENSVSRPETAGIGLLVSAIRCLQAICRGRGHREPWNG